MKIVRIFSFRCLSLACLFGLVLTICPPSIRSAYGQASIIPKIQEIDIRRGGTTQFDLQIANRGADPLTFIVQANNLSITDEGLPNISRENSDLSCIDWITFTPSEFTLQSGEVKIVQGVVHAPKEAEGSYSAFIAARFNIETEPFILDEKDKLEARLNLGKGVSSILLITAHSSRNFVQLKPDSLVLSSGQDSNLEITSPLYGSTDSEGWQAEISVENIGNTHAKATGEISIWREDGRLVDRSALTAGRGFVLRGAKRIFRAVGEKPLTDGIYMFKVHIRTKKGRLTQGTFPYSIVKGKTIPGVASESIRALIRASTPTFSLAKRMLDFKITGNGKRTQGINLQNHGPDSLIITPTVVEWSLDDKGQVTLNPDQNQLVRSCASWLTVSPNPIQIPPKRSASVKVTVTAPSELDGEYYAAVRFDTPDLPQNLPSELEMPRTLMMTVSSSRGLDYMAEIESFQYEPVSPLMRFFAVNVMNTGNVHCYVSGKLELYDLAFNQILEPVTFGGRTDYVLPERVHGYAVPCPGALAPGTYEAVVMIEYHDGAEAEVATLDFDVVNE